MQTQILGFSRNRVLSHYWLHICSSSSGAVPFIKQTFLVSHSPYPSLLSSWPRLDSQFPFYHLPSGRYHSLAPPAGPLRYLSFCLGLDRGFWRGEAEAAEGEAVLRFAGTRGRVAFVGLVREDANSPLWDCCEVACGYLGDWILCPWSLSWNISGLRLGSAPSNSQSSSDQDPIIIVRTEEKIFLWKLRMYKNAGMFEEHRKGSPTGLQNWISSGDVGESSAQSTD